MSRILEFFSPLAGLRIPVQDSYVRLPDSPGVGFKAKAELYKLMKTLIEN